MPFGSHPPITAPIPIPAETGLGPVAGYSGFKAFDWKATQSFPTALTSGPLRFCISCRLLNARHLGFETNVWKIKDLVQTVDQEVGGSNPPSCTKRMAHPVPNPLFVRLVATRGKAFSSTPASTCLRLGALHDRSCGYDSQGRPAAHNTPDRLAFCPSYSCLLGNALGIPLEILISCFVLVPAVDGAHARDPARLFALTPRCGAPLSC